MAALLLQITDAGLVESVNLLCNTLQVVLLAYLGGLAHSQASTLRELPKRSTDRLEGQ